MEASYDATQVKDSTARKVCQGAAKWRRSLLYWLYLCVVRPDMRCPRTRFVTPAMRRKGGEGDLAQRSSALVFFSLLISRVPATRRHNNWRRATIRDDVVAAARVFCLGCRLRAAASSERPVAASCPALQSNAAADVLRTVPLRSQSPQTTGTEK